MLITTTLLAQVRNPIIRSNYGTGWNYLNTSISSIVSILFTIATVVFVFIFIVGAFQWITSGSDREKLASARGKITHAIVGLLVLLLIFLIAQFVNAILGLNIGFIGGPGSNECSTICRDLNYSSGYCADGSNPTPRSGCVNSGSDCHNPTRDCMCCGSGNASGPTVTGNGVPTIAGDEQNACYMAGGEWTLFPNSAADNCGAGSFLLVSTWGCDCGDSMCWNGSGCQSLNPPTPTSEIGVIIISSPPVRPTSTPVPTDTPAFVSGYCSDTDSGMDIFTFGIVTENTLNPGVELTHADYCFSSTLTEYACSLDQTPVSARVDCSSYGGAICLRGECCYNYGFGCSSDSDCCSPYSCSGGICKPTSNIILNEASGKSCTNLCWDSGFRTGTFCQSIGTDLDEGADNGETVLRNCTITTSYSCDSPILFSSSTDECGGHMTNWTYCNCVPNPFVQ